MSSLPQDIEHAVGQLRQIAQLAGEVDEVGNHLADVIDQHLAPLVTTAQQLVDELDYAKDRIEEAEEEARDIAREAELAEQEVWKTEAVRLAATAATHREAVRAGYDTARALRASGGPTADMLADLVEMLVEEVERA